MMKDLKKKFDDLRKSAVEELQKISQKEFLEDFQIHVLGRKGQLAFLMKELQSIPHDLRPEIGKFANEVKIFLHDSMKTRLDELQKLQGEENKLFFDYTFPGIKPKIGHFHPLTKIRNDLADFFSQMGFVALDGPEVELDYYNFEAVNIPKDHPARDMQDTFYTQDNHVLRTHTSSVQIRAMREYGAPLRAIVPGRCFRNEATDVRHDHTFYQIEGMMIDKEISVSHLKGVLEVFLQFLFGEDISVRFRPKFYPFVEPGLNIEVTCFLCQAKGCRVCKSSGWLEVGGAGMIHPNVFKEGKIDSKKYQGFAFGCGLERFIMLQHHIEDIRLFQSGDMQFLEQF